MGGLYREDPPLLANFLMGYFIDNHQHSSCKRCEFSVTSIFYFKCSYCHFSEAF